MIQQPSGKPIRQPWIFANYLFNEFMCHREPPYMSLRGMK
jgi:hypothetical protein